MKAGALALVLVGASSPALLLGGCPAVSTAPHPDAGSSASSSSSSAVATTSSSSSAGSGGAGGASSSISTVDATATTASAGGGGSGGSDLDAGDGGDAQLDAAEAGQEDAAVDANADGGDAAPNGPCASQPRGMTCVSDGGRFCDGDGGCVPFLPVTCVEDGGTHQGADACLGIVTNQGKTVVVWYEGSEQRYCYSDATSWGYCPPGTPCSANFGVGGPWWSGYCQ